MAATSVFNSVLLQSNCMIVEAVSRQSGIVLFLHGLGDTGLGWSQLLCDVCPPHTKLICPTAPIMPVTVNNGAKMPSWFDIYNLSKEGKQDVDGIKNASKKVHLALEELEKSGTPSNRIVLGGFSQGGSLAIHAALTYPHSLAGLLCLSCWVPNHIALSQECLECNKSISMLQCHGDSDNVITYDFGVLTSQFLSSLNPKNHSFKTYHGLGHSADPKELDDVKDWLSQVLPPHGGAM